MNFKMSVEVEVIPRDEDECSTECGGLIDESRYGSSYCAYFKDENGRLTHLGLSQSSAFRCAACKAREKAP